ncbi:MAG: alpha/beta fold hydrolase, partial [Burkholderiaceae bacterium]
MNPKTVRQSVNGPAGVLECAIDDPTGEPHGTVVICHPHPQHGGTMDNKVVQTLARGFVQLGWRSVRFNFRGVGASEGDWDDGAGEVDDALAVIAALRGAGAAFMLAGFSFGAYVAAQAATRLPAEAKPQRMVLVGPSTQRQQMADVPSDTVVIHGETDDVVPLSATLDWARPLSLPVIVFPGV